MRNLKTHWSGFCLSFQCTYLSFGVHIQELPELPTQKVCDTTANKGLKLIHGCLTDVVIIAILVFFSVCTIPTCHACTTSLWSRVGSWFCSINVVNNWMLVCSMSVLTCCASIAHSASVLAIRLAYCRLCGLFFFHLDFDNIICNSATRILS